MNRKLTIAVTFILLLLFKPNTNLSQIVLWQPIGPWGGTVNDIAIAPSQTNILYALQRLSVLKSIENDEL
jgi:hypothetical protein